MAPIEKVQTGQPMRIPASTYNAMVEAAQDFRQRTRGSGADPLESARYEGVVRVRNSTTADFGLYGVVGLGDMVIGYDDNPQSFYSRPCFEAEAPLRTAALNYGKHVAKMAVVQEPIASGAIGRAKIAGLTPVQINIVNEYDDIGILQNGNTTSLKSWTSGESGASILWHKPGTTGVQWCLALLGNFRSKFASMYRVTLDGTLSTADASVTVDNLIPMDGIQHLLTDSLTAHNIFAWEASNNANALVVWNNHTGLERWELIQLDCT